MTGAIAPQPRFDGAVIWRQLNPREKADIGAAALELAVAWACHHAYSGVDGAALLWRTADASEQALHNLLYHRVLDVMPGEFMAAPQIPSLLGAICRVCACSAFDPCPEGCGWAEPDLCTACVVEADHAPQT